jgi:hypothetical protein
MKRKLLAAVAATALLAGCAGSDPAPADPPSAANLQPIAFHCPAPGTQVTFANGRTAIYESNPSDPLICAGQSPDGGSFRKLCNYFADCPASLNQLDDSEIRQAMGELFAAVTESH